MKKHKLNADLASPEDPNGLHFQTRQARAYDTLLPVYQSRLSLLQPVHGVVLDRVLDGFECDLSVLEVGCGFGSSLQLIAKRGFCAEGIDMAPEMVQAARRLSGCPVICGDFLQHEFSKRYHLVFAQAFVHLFPKAMACEVIRRLQSLALRRVFFSTSLASRSSEGWEDKDGVVRYRSRYTVSEFMDLVELSTSGTPWRVEFFDLPDPLGKNWRDIILHHI